VIEFANLNTFMMHAPNLINCDRKAKRQEMKLPFAGRGVNSVCLLTAASMHAALLKADACSRPSGHDEACVISWGSASSFAGIWGIYAGADLKQAGLNPCVARFLSIPLQVSGLWR